MNFKSNTSRRIFVPAAFAALISLGLLFFPAGQKTKAAPPCPFIVDALSNPGFTHTTIQAAVNDLPDPGPCVVVVRAATYAEQVNINDKNRAATSESQRISIVADPAALPGTVIVDPPGTTNTGFVVNHSKFITVKGFLITGAEKGITMAGGSNSSDDIKLEANHIHTIGSTGASGTVGIGVGSGNARTVVVNNLIRNVGRSGIDVDSPNSDPIYIVNNTIVSNMWNGVTRAVSANVFLINNLIVGNGISSGGSGNCRTGLCQTSNGTAATVTLVNNMFYNNVGGDLSTPAQQLDATDSGNRTTTGAEGTGIIGCTFSDCLNTHVLDEIFASSGTGNYHLRTSPPISPAIDKGVNSFVHDPDGVGPLPAEERVPLVDFDFHARPFDGDNNAVPVTDIGFDEALAPTAADGVLSGSVLATDGKAIEGAVIRLDGTQSRKTITDANGNFSFDNVETTGFYSVRPSRANYSFSPAERSFSQLGNRTEAVFTATPDAVAGVNAIDTAEYFVRQHYLDFLGREPEEAGFNFWSDQILECGVDSGCVERRRINVSAAFFLSIEFQRTGGLVDSLYRASYGRQPFFAEFMPDTRSIAQNVIVGRSGWEQQLAANTQAFVDAWVQRPAFQSAYGGLGDDAYVDALISQTGVSYSQTERDALVSGLSGGTLSRGDALLRIAEDERFVSAKRNEVFVMMEYFGFLRRDPDASGYRFWLDKLNQFNGNFEQAEMVKAFIVSGEYRDRFPF